jgi:hypothetical protein
MHVKMTRIESGVTVPKGLFTLYVNVKIVMAKIVWPPQYHYSLNVYHYVDQKKSLKF